MAKRELIYHPNELLRAHAEPVAEIDAETRELAEEMIRIMESSDGIGLAGPQVGVLERLFVVEVPEDRPRVFINPQILETSLETKVYEEGCLSIPGVYAELERSARVRIQAWNERGRPFNIEAERMLARVIQHEYDHLNGVLFIDHLPEKKRERILRKYAAPVAG
ncbi:MAG: peptide deformylase [Spirochaetaceae bacterium]